MQGSQTINQKADSARRLLDDPLFREVLESIKTFHVEQIVDSMPDDKQGREHSYHMLKCVDEIVDELKNYTIDATIEQRKSK